MDMSMSSTNTSWQSRARALGTCLITSLLVGCGGPAERPQSKAQVGEILVRQEGTTVRLAHAFRTAEPNALVDGVVRVEAEGGQQLLEVNAVCSMPNTPNWPSYDNLFGRPIQRVQEAKGATGTTRWQVLFHYDGRVETRMGESPGPWLARLRDNLCRRGDFDDRPTKR
jgi:ribosomal protein L27